MSAARARGDGTETEDSSVSQSAGESEEKPQAWQKIDTGRYMPRRIRGSLLGRELG